MSFLSKLLLLFGGEHISSGMEEPMTDKEKRAHEFAVMYAKFALDRTNDVYASKPGETAIDFAIASYMAARDRFINATPN